MFPAAIFAIIVGTKSGETHLGPSLRSFSVSRICVVKPPMPEPTYTPYLNGSMFPPSAESSPDWRTACHAAATPKRVNLSCFLAKAGSIPYSSGLKSLTSPAIFTGISSVGKEVIISIPQTPARRFCQKAFTSFPIGVTAPSPVTTTRLVLFILQR